MKRDVAIILLPEGVDPCNVRSPDGSYVQHVWFEEETADGDGALVGRAFAKAGQQVALRVSERAS